MDYTPIYYMFSQGPSTKARVWLNGIPLRQHWGTDGKNVSDGAVHLLKPGDNTFAIEVQDAPSESQVFFELSVEFDHDHPVFYFEWPGMVREIPIAERTPIRYESAFCPLGDLFTPIYLSTPPQSFGREGNAALRHAVERLHAAVAASDADDFFAQNELRIAENVRAYDGWDGVNRNELYQETVEFFSQGIEVRPLELDKVYFESCAEGRVACARHTEGECVIEAVSLDDPGSVLRIEPLLTLHEGQWQLFR